MISASAATHLTITCSRRKMFLVSLLVSLIALNMLFIFTISFSAYVYLHPVVFSCHSCSLSILSSFAKCVFFRYVAVGAIIGFLTLYSCSCSIYNSLIVCFCDRETMQRSFFVSTILSNAFSCLMLLVIALLLNGHNPTISFTQDTFICSALLSAAFAYPLWLYAPTPYLQTALRYESDGADRYVPEPEGDTLTEPITISTSVTAVVNGAQALSKNRCPTHTPFAAVRRRRPLAGSCSSSPPPASFCRTA